MYTAHSLLLHQSIFSVLLSPNLTCLYVKEIKPSGVPWHYVKIPFDNDFPGSKKKM